MKNYNFYHFNLLRYYTLRLILRSLGKNQEMLEIFEKLLDFLYSCNGKKSIFIPFWPKFI